MPRAIPLVAGGLALLVTAGCEYPPPESVQRGYRGVGMVEYTNPRILKEQVRENVPPAVVAEAAPVPVPAGTVYKNLKVLGDVPITEFTRTMNAITEWVVPRDQWDSNGQGCVYCHDLADMASDAKYTKVVARSMFQMTQRANSAWSSHSLATGVTCYTCHRGQAVPKNSWSTNPGLSHASGQVSPGQNRLSPVPAFAALPYDPKTVFFDQEQNIPITPTRPVRVGHATTVNTKQTEYTYAMMMYISRSLGVGCNHCHNSRQFADWAQSLPTKTQAWYAIRQVRELNKNFIWPLADILPASRKGPLGDPLRIGCETCHQGVYKPLFGAPMAKDYPALLKSTQSAPPAAAPPVEAVPPAPASAKTDADAPATAKVTG